MEPEDLDSMTRAELEDRAADAGVAGADAMPNKGAIVEAIRAAGAGGAPVRERDTPGGPGPSQYELSSAKGYHGTIRPGATVAGVIPGGR